MNSVAHIETCRVKFGDEKDVDFQLSDKLETLPDESITSIFAVTGLQHIIVEHNLRKEVLQQFRRVLSDDGVLLSAEWAEGQREYDWCTAVLKRDYGRYFDMRVVGQVIEQGRKSRIWFGRKRPPNLLTTLRVLFRRF